MRPPACPRFLNASWLLGPALTNTGLHELGRFIADLEHTADPTNIMSDGNSKRKLADAPSRASASSGRRRRLSTTTRRSAWWRRYKTGVWLGGMTVTPVP